MVRISLDKTHYLLIVILAVVVSATTGVTVFTLYQTAYQEQSNQLRDTVSSQARMIESVALYDAQFDYSGDAQFATFSQIRDAHERYQSAKKSGEFTLGKLEGEQIIFLLKKGGSQENQSNGYTMGGEYAVPMQRALAGESGVMVALDYRGKEVLAAFEPVEKLNYGVVAKVDLEEVQAPFIDAVLLSLTVGVLLTIWSGFGFYRVTTPLIRDVVQSREEALEGERRIEKVNAQLEQAQKLGQLGSWSLDHVSGSLQWSKEIYRIFEVDPEKFGASYAYFVELIHPDDRERVDQAFQNSLKRQQPYTIRHRLQFTDGRIKHVEVSGITTYSDAGEPLLSTGTVQDISDRVKVEQAKDEFLASMSHELRTPLTAIIGNSELLMQSNQCGGSRCPQQDAEQILQSIHIAGNNQLALVNDMLDMSKIESGKFSVDEAPYDLSKLLNEVESIFSVRAADAGIRFVLDQKHHDNHLLMGDVQRILQVLINLVGNAIKFTEQGEVRLTVWLDAEKLHFQVKDTGVGMPREVVERLFQRFHQADNSISRRFGGSGLGLYISENLTDLMGGEIDVSSEEGIGSSFQLVLPYQPIDTLVQQVHEAAAPTLDEQLSGRALIAEDTPELQLLERRILESMGLEVAVAKDGQEAVDRVNSQPFDVVLMDMQMPILDGIEATRLLRQQGHTLPIVALTANVMQKHREAFDAAGCDDFLGKPIDKGELRRLLKQHLPQRVQTSTVQQVLPEEVDEEMMAIFKQSAANYNDAIKTALASKDWEALRTAAHTVKGSAAYFGFSEISKKAEVVQLAVDEENLDLLPELTMDLLLELGKIL